MIGLLAAASPTPIDFSQIDFSKFTPEEIAETESHRDQLKQDLANKLQTVATVNTSQGATLQQSQLAANEVQKSFAAYQAAAEAQITAGNKAIAALSHVLKKLHLAKWIVTGLWVAICVFIWFNIPVMLKQYALFACGGLAVAGSTFIWAWL